MKKMVMLLLAFLCLAPAMAEVRAEGADSVALVPEGRLSELAVAPVFRKGGFEKYCTWVMSRLKYPEDAEARKVEGRVTMRVIVEPDGSVTPGEVLESPDPALTEAVVRIVEGSPHWKPGAVRCENGETLRPVRVMYTLSVAFKVRPRAQDPYTYRWRPQDQVRPYGSN